MTEVVILRNPYPLPQLEHREGVFVRRPVLGKKVFPNDKAWSAKLKVGERLFAHHTLNSVRKDTRLIRPEVPNDSLDFTLKTVYSQSRDTMLPKRYVTMQAESLGRKTWRLLKNKIEIYKIPKVMVDEFDPISRFLKESECYRGPMEERRGHPSNVKLNITGPHSVQSNPGYSRKIDGTFYSI